MVSKIMVQPWKAGLGPTCMGHLVTFFQERPMPGRTQRKGLLQDGDGISKEKTLAHRKKSGVRNQTSREKAKEDLERLFTGVLCASSSSSRGKEGTGGRTSLPSERPSRLRTQ